MTIEQRLEHLERRANRYRNVLVLLVICVFAVELIEDTIDDEIDGEIIRAKGLEVTNDEGQVLISAGSDTSGDGQLTVNSKTGKELIYAGADEGGNGQLTVNSKTGKQLIHAGAGGSGNGFGFAGFNKTGEGVVEMYADDDGNVVVNRKGKGRTLKPGP